MPRVQHAEGDAWRGWWGCGRGAALYRANRGVHRGGGGDHQGGVSIKYRGRNPCDMTQRGPHSSAPQTRGSPKNAGSRWQWRGRTPHRGRSSRASQGGGGRGGRREPQDPCTQ